MKRFLIPFAALALLLAGSAFSANVTDVELSHLNNGYVAKIKVTDGPVRFQHQVEEPKNGKPYRVIVDVLSATHELGGQSFGNLPTCPIQQIRTSQFAVTPEKITRIVFDMADAPLYSVSDAEPGYVKVIFTNRNVQPFITWSSSANSGQPAAPAKAEPVVAKASPPATKSADAFNDKAQSDKLASLSASESVPVPASPGPNATTRKPAYVAKKEAASTPTVTATPKSTESTPVAKAQPKQDPKTQAVRQVDRPTVVVAPTPTPNPHAQTEAQPTAAKPKAMPAKDPVKGSASPEAVVAKKAAEDKKVSADVTRPSAPSNTVAKKADPQPAKTEPAPSKKVEIAQKPADASAEPVKKTSRFRRSPTTPIKLKGTMVAEFPKRLVIKYKTRSHRDPFATLIDDTKSYDSPVEQRVPNIEGLRLVGIIEADGGTNQALFEDNTGYSYILKSGDKVKKGYVLRVEADRVYFQIFEYGWSRTVALEIEE